MRRREEGIGMERGKGHNSREKMCTYLRIGKYGKNTDPEIFEEQSLSNFPKSADNKGGQKGKGRVRQEWRRVQAGGG